MTGAPRESLSVCVITFNEESNLEACLDSVRFADEIIVVDSGSTDRTVEIARRFTDRVIGRGWPGHIAQKNFAADQATKEWILAIDADERVTPALRAEIEAVLSNPRGEPIAERPLGYRFPRKTHYLGRFWTRGGWYPDLQLRVWRRGRGRWGGDDPHDHVLLDGPPGRLRSELLHFTYKNMSDHLRTVNFFTAVAARAKTVRGVRFAIASLTIGPAWRFFRTYVLKGAWREGIAGFVFAVIDAFYVFLKHAKMWERQHLGTDDPLAISRQTDTADPKPTDPSTG